MALCEYGCPSLNYVYDMSWAEFRIRQFGYNRKQKNDLYKIREVAFASIIGPHLDPKKVPTKERYMPLSENTVDNDKIKKRMADAILKYKNDINGKSTITSTNRSRNNGFRKKPRKSTKKPSKV